jgi:hypothetical protein
MEDAVWQLCTSLENGGNFALLQKMANISHFGGEWQTLCILAKNEKYPVYNVE